ASGHVARPQGGGSARDPPPGGAPVPGAARGRGCGGRRAARRPAERAGWHAPSVARARGRGRGPPSRVLGNAGPGGPDQPGARPLPGAGLRRRRAARRKGPRGDDRLRPPQRDDRGRAAGRSGAGGGGGAGRGGGAGGGAGGPVGGIAGAASPPRPPPGPAARAALRGDDRRDGADQRDVRAHHRDRRGGPHPGRAPEPGRHRGPHEEPARDELPHRARLRQEGQRARAHRRGARGDRRRLPLPPGRPSAGGPHPGGGHRPEGGGGLRGDARHREGGRGVGRLRPGPRPGSREEALSPGALPGPRRGAGARGPGAQAYARPPLASPPPRMILGALLLLVPVSLALAYVVHASALWVFATSVLAIVPLAEWIRRATEQTARLAGPTIGGLLNVTFGNMAELILALFVLSAGHAEVVKAQI